MARFLILLVLGTMVISCAPQTLFVWGGYESSLYKYYKNPEKLEQYQNSLEQAVAKGQIEGKVAPGLMAELGFLAMERGDTNVAVKYFEQEMATFPESRPFMQKVITRLNEGQGVADDQDLVS